MKLSQGKASKTKLSEFQHLIPAQEGDRPKWAPAAGARSQQHKVAMLWPKSWVQMLQEPQVVTSPEATGTGKPETLKMLLERTAGLKLGNLGGPMSLQMGQNASKP